VKSEDGHLHQAGGHEWVACDYGSGFWIGLKAIRAAYRDYEAGTDSVLLQRLRQVYGIRPDDNRGLIAKLRDLAVADPNMKKEIARFAASVCDAAERGDVPAQNIVKEEAEDLADVTAGLLRRQFTASELTQGVGLVECGSLLGNTLYRTSFEAQIELRLRSGIEQRAAIAWQRVTTGGAACIRLARDLAEPGAIELLRSEVAFRPSIVRIR
jgi:N-acetylglucosamine kinase-like BadF-type ATPase